MNGPVVIEPGDGTIKFVARRFSCHGFLHLLDFRPESGQVKILDGFRGVREDRKYFVRKLGQTSQHHKLLVRASGDSNHNSGTKHGDDRRMSGKDTKIALDTG
jgi:hypothetical protein